jgi:hypothetical protein
LKPRIKTHQDLEVYRVAFDAAMKMFELSKGFPAAEWTGMRINLPAEIIGHTPERAKNLRHRRLLTRPSASWGPIGHLPVIVVRILKTTPARSCFNRYTRQAEIVLRLESLGVRPRYVLPCGL